MTKGKKAALRGVLLVIAVAMVWRGCVDLIFLLDGISGTFSTHTVSEGAVLPAFQVKSAVSPQLSSVGTTSDFIQTVTSPMETESRLEVLEIFASLVEKHPQNFDLRKRLLLYLAESQSQEEFNNQLNNFLEDFSQMTIPESIREKIDAYREGKAAQWTDARTIATELNNVYQMQTESLTINPMPIKAEMNSRELTAESARDLGIGVLMDYQEWDSAANEVERLPDSELKASYELDLLLRKGRTEEAKALLSEVLTGNPEFKELSVFEQILIENSRRTGSMPDPNFLSFQLKRLRSNLLKK